MKDRKYPVVLLFLTIFLSVGGCTDDPEQKTESVQIRSETEMETAAETEEAAVTLIPEESPQIELPFLPFNG